MNAYDLHRMADTIINIAEMLDLGRGRLEFVDLDDIDTAVDDLVRSRDELQKRVDELEERIAELTESDDG